MNTNFATFRIPSTIHYGVGALNELGATARQLGFNRVLLVTDAGMVKLGVAGQAQSLLEKAGLRVAVFDGVLLGVMAWLFNVRWRMA